MRKVNQWSRTLAKRNGRDFPHSALNLLLKYISSMEEKCDDVKAESPEAGESNNPQKRKRKGSREGGTPVIKEKISKLEKETPFSFDGSVTNSQKPVLQKAEMGLSALLVAAGIANNQSLLEPLNGLSANTAVTEGLEKDFSNADSLLDAGSGMEKKARKSSRLASKRAKQGGVTKKGKASVSGKSAAGVEPTAEERTSGPSGMDDTLTNLDLLSSVSAQLASIAPMAVVKPRTSDKCSSDGPPAAHLPHYTNTGQRSKPLETPLIVTEAAMSSGQNLTPSIPAFGLMSSEKQQLATSNIGRFKTNTDTSLSEKSQQGYFEHNIPLPVLDNELFPPGRSISHRAKRGGKIGGSNSSELTLERPQDCGAMDLSKRRHLSPSIVTQDSSRSTSPQSPSVFVGGKQQGKASTNIMKRLLMMGPGSQNQTSNQNPRPPSANVPVLVTAPAVQSLHLTALTSSKEADDNLQARIFAGAKNYRFEGEQNSGTGHGQGAANASIGSPLKQLPKPLSNEIQCGYKWSGSGGLVKERTQMVREVVPSNFILDLLNKKKNSSSNIGTNRLPSKAADKSISAPSFGVPKKAGTPSTSTSYSSIFQLADDGPACLMLPSKATKANIARHLQEKSACMPLALNLSKNLSDSPDNHGRLTVLPSTLLPTMATPVSIVSKPGPRAALSSSASARGQTPVSMLKGPPVTTLPSHRLLLPVGLRPVRHSSLPADIPLTSFDQGSIGTVSGTTVSTVAAKMFPHPTSITPVSLFCNSPTSSVVSASIPISSLKTISSPSLAAILRQPPSSRTTTATSTSNSNDPLRSVPADLGLQPLSVRTENPRGKVPQERDGVEIKIEPIDVEYTEAQGALRNMLRLKEVRVKKEASDTNDSNSNSNSGSNVADLSPPSSGKTSASCPDMNVGSADKSANQTAQNCIKCEFCSLPISSSQDSNKRHVCQCEGS